MDSYEKMRKMGEISKELKKHGLASNSSDAIKQAEDMMMSDKDKEVYVTQDETPTQENQEAAPENEVRNFTVKFNDKIGNLSSEIALIRNKMNEIIGKINELETKMSAQPKQEVQATLPTSEKQKEPEKEEPPGNVKPEVKKEYESDDVSVEKVFYVGKK